MPESRNSTGPPISSTLLKLKLRIYLKKSNHEPHKPHERYSVIRVSLLPPILLFCFFANKTKIRVKSGLPKQEFVMFVSNQDNLSGIIPEIKT
jgi:hypothetical protein